jgi:8-oxo-dGTP diphosphatase
MINCRFENGKEASLRHVVVDAVCVKEGKILLEKRNEKLTHGGKYCLPGGHLQRDETTEQGILRELKEETGYDGKIVKLLKVIDNPDRGEDRQNVSFLYLVEPTEKSGPGDGESAEVVWFDLEKLPKPEEFAFDHHLMIQYYLENKKEK